MDSDISSKGWLIRFSIPLLIVILSTICFQFGVNVENIPDEDSKGILMHILYALSLFTLGGVSLGVPISGPLWAIRLLYVMYYLAPAVSLGALIEHLFISARFYLRFKILKGNHFVIIGAGRVATQIPEKLNLMFKKNYKRTKLGIEVPIVVADKNKDALMSSLNSYNILSLNAEDPTIIKSLNLSKAKMIFILTDNDWVNVNLFFILKNHFSSKPNLKKIPKIFIRIKSEDLLIELKQNHFDTNAIFFNVHIEAIKLLMSEAKMKNEIYHNWLKKLKQSVPQTIVFLGFGRFGQHTLLSYINSDSIALKDSIKKVIIISPHANNEWEHYKLLSSIKHKKITDTIEFKLYSSNNENISLLNEVIIQTQNDKSVLWVLGAGNEEVNLHTSTIINRINEISCVEKGMNPDMFMLIRTKTMNNSYEELVNKKNEKHILMPTYDLIGDYFYNKFIEIS